MEDICERAGFTRGAFYSNFTDKDDVLQAMVERDQGRLLAHLDASFSEVNDELAAAESLAIPIYAELSLEQQETIVGAIAEFLRGQSARRSRA